MSLPSLPSATSETSEILQAEDSTSEGIVDSTLMPEESTPKAEAAVTLVNNGIQEPEDTNNSITEDHPESISLGSIDEELNSQNQEQRYNQESNYFHSNEATESDILPDIKDTKQSNCEHQSEEKEKRYSGDISNFLESVYDLLECPVCLNHMVPPILLCESGHNICFKCRPFMTKCPLCRQSFLRTRNIALEVVAQKLGLKCIHEDCHKGCRSMKEQEQQVSIDQMVYTCPLTLYSHCYWQGNHSDIKRHMEEIHASKILTETTNPFWEMNLVVRDFKVIFALDEIFFYKERLDTSNSKFYIQVFYVGQRENHSKFVYNLEISSETGQQRVVIYNTTLPINDLEHTYTYTASHCTVLDYQTIRGMSKHGDLKCTLSLGRHLRE
ncbi:E3 ubiquitin-protein ligase [Gryllus bimaculatus]|nr:E3 ubiquitin-protein ligase [Gryllus bimaculatus]